jgi:hypothetical protein
MHLVISRFRVYYNTLNLNIEIQGRSEHHMTYPNITLMLLRNTHIVMCSV